MIDLNNVSLVIATYNEEESIEFVLNELNSYEFFEIIVIDNNSSDKTLEIANKFNKKILQQKGRGWGNAVLEGLNAASENMLIIWMQMDHITQNNIRNVSVT